MARVEHRADEMHEALQDGLWRFLDEAANTIVDRAKKNAPVETGELRDSIERQAIEREPEGESVEIGAYAEYASPIEWGSAGKGEPLREGHTSDNIHTQYPLIPPNKVRWGPYPLNPKPPSQFLIFKVEDGWVTTDEVIHPGIDPQPFMRPAIDRTISDMVWSDVDYLIHREVQKVLPKNLMADQARLTKGFALF